MTTIAVEDVAEEPEGSRVQAAVSEASTKEPPDIGEEVGEPPAEPPVGPPAKPTIPEPAVAKAGPATAKVRCPKCEKELLPKTFRYSHYCGGVKPARHSGAQLLDKPPGLEPLKTAPAPRVKAAPRANSPRQKRQHPPPDPETSSASDDDPPPEPVSPMLDRRHTPDLRVRALMRQSSSARPQRFAGLLAGSLPS
jgi:hypothetical protein